VRKRAQEKKKKNLSGTRQLDSPQAKPNRAAHEEPETSPTRDSKQSYWI